MYRSMVSVLDEEESFKVETSPTGRISIEVTPRTSGLMELVITPEQAKQLANAINEHLQAPQELDDSDDVPF